MRRRTFLATTGASVFLRPQFARAEKLAVSYKQQPPYFPYHGLIEPGHDAFIEEAAAYRTRKPSLPVAPHPNPWFREVTGSVLDSEQLRKGVPYWAARLDSAAGIDIYGNNGIAVADIDGDGSDEVYVCQPAGLPNRLFRWNGSKLVDISAAAGLDVLDSTSCALFLDLRNLGRQDAILMRDGGPLLFLNDGRGKFTHIPNAFRFAVSPAGTFTGMAAADYDRDGKLDVYCCCYSFFQSEAQYRYPSPYHDAQNGPPNFLFRNRLNANGSGFFEDVTVPVGLSENNNRFSFAPAWCDYDNSGWPSLYVANDFGRNNLYKNDGGKFRDVASTAGVEDIGPGMSACWFDENGDGRPDLYVGNMWSESGQRVVASKAFKNAATPELKEAYRRHSKGNSLYRNTGGGKFTDDGAALGVEMGRWAWSCDAHDFDNDGQAEIYIACGMLTGDKQPDLMSFFWRHVVASSPAGKERSTAYERGWNAINQFIREGYSWNGGEANVCYKKEGTKYRDASYESGLGVACDSRAFAVTDFNGDGCLDLFLKSRLGPQLRVFQNITGPARNTIGFVLEGRKSNRDAIGARLELDGQTKWLQAGSGYLSQHTKTVYFGLSDASVARGLRVDWPSGEVQSFVDLEAGYLYRIVENQPILKLRKFADSKPLAKMEVIGENKARLEDTWFADPIPLPSRHAGPGLLILHGREKPKVPGEMVDLTKDSDLAAAYSLFRRYLFEYRGELELPLALLLDESGRAIKVYEKIPGPDVVKQDLKNTDVASPYPGLRINPSHREFFKLGAALLWSGYGEQALPYLEEVLRRDPENSQTMVLAAQIHREAGRLGAARPSLDHALRLDPESAEAWNEMGGVHQALSEDGKALQYFLRAVAVKGDLTYALLNAAQASMRLDRPSEAEQYFGRVAKIDPQSSEAFNGLGLAQARGKKTAQAAASFREAIRLQPSYGPAWNNLAVLLLGEGKTDQAASTLRDAIGKAPLEEILYLNMGRIHLGRGNRAEAISVMRELLRVKPDSKVAQQALADLSKPAK